MQLAPDRGRSPKDLADIESDVHIRILLAARLLPQDRCHWSYEALHVWVQQLSLLLVLFQLQQFKPKTKLSDCLLSVHEPPLWHFCWCRSHGLQ